MKSHTHRQLLSIPEPCPEKWEDMQDAPEGKYCDSCEKNIYDFTELNQEQIIGLHELSGGNICGKIKISQLDINPMYAWIKKQVYWSRFKTFIIALILVFGQQLFETPVIFGQSIPDAKIENNSADYANIIEGKVIDSTGIAVGFATVVLTKNGVTVSSTFTESDGYFQIENIQPGTLDLNIFYLGVSETINGLILKESMDLDIGLIKLNAQIPPLLNVETYNSRIFVTGMVGRTEIITTTGIVNISSENPKKQVEPIIDPEKMWTGNTIKRDQIERGHNFQGE